MGKGAKEVGLLDVLRTCSLESHHADFTSRGINTVEEAQRACLTWLSDAQASKVTTVQCVRMTELSDVSLSLAFPAAESNV